MVCLAELSALHAQPSGRPGTDPSSATADPRALEGLPIESIDWVAPPREVLAELASLSGLEVGAHYRAIDVRRAVKVLHQLGRFENVFARAGRFGGQVRVQMILTPRPFVREVTVLGSEALRSSAVARILELRIGDELDVESFPRRREALVEALRRLGHRSPAIGLAVRDQDANGGAEVVCRISEGPITRLRRFVIRGSPRRPFWQLADSFGITPGEAIDLEKVDVALAELRVSYREEDYLEVEIGEPEVRPLNAEDSEAPTADLVLSIDSGPAVEVRFKGKTVVPDWELETVHELLRELGTNRAALDEARERVLAAYERRGYWRAKVDAGVRVTPDNSRKQILFSIFEGRRARVERLEFRGNRTLDEAILTAKVRQVVESALTSSRELDRPATDPKLVSSLLGDNSLGKARDRPQPHPASPDPEFVYLRNAYRSAATELADFYRAEGFQNVQVQEPIVRVEPDGASLHITFEIEEGVQWRLGAVSFAGNSTVSSGELLDLSYVTPGGPVSFFQLEAARRTLQQVYRDRGYLYATVDQELREIAPRGTLATAQLQRGKNVIQVCEQAATRGEKVCEVELVFRVREGPEVFARRIVIKGAGKTLESLVRGEVTVKENETLRASDMRRTQLNLARLGLFSRVAVKPLDEETEDTNKDVLIELKERKQWAFELGAGASTEDGVRAFGRLTWSNVGGTGLRAQLHAGVSSQPLVVFYAEEIRDAISTFYANRPIEYQLALGLSWPRVLGLPRGFNAGVDFSFVRDTEPAFGEDAIGVRFSGGYSALRPTLWGRERPVILNLRAYFDNSQVQCNTALPTSQQYCGAQSVDQATRSQAQTSYLGGGPTIGWDWRDDRFNPHSGIYAELAPSYLGGLNEDSPSHIRLEGRLNAYVPLLLRSTLALSMSYQRIFETGATDVQVPVNRRIYAGGRSTIRGYQERTLFPQDLILCGDGQTAPIGYTCRNSDELLSPGGLLSFAMKAELRIPVFEGFALTAFYDAGDLFLDPSNFFVSFVPSDRGQTRQGVGAGIRYDTPVGPLILDIGVPLVSRGDPNEVSWTPHFAAVGTF